MSYRPAPRRRHSAAVYRRRRIAVGLAAVLSVGAVVVAGRAVLGGGDDSAASASTDGPNGTAVSASGAPSDSSVPVSDSSSPTGSTTTTVASNSATQRPADWVPTATDQARLYIAGDSDAGTFGPYLETLMGQTGIVNTTLDYKVSSGLSRPDFYDWSARFAEQLPANSPDIVVVTFGGNDAQGIYSLDEGKFILTEPTAANRDEWMAEYGSRVGETMDLLSADGRTLIWVGIPNDDSPEVTARMRIQDEAVKAEAAKRPNVILIDTWSRFSGRDGDTWAEYIVDPRDGETKDVRADDGFHLNETGAEILALDIAEAIRGALRERGATL